MAACRQCTARHTPQARSTLSRPPVIDPARAPARLALPADSAPRFGPGHASSLALPTPLVRPLDQVAVGAHTGTSRALRRAFSLVELVIVVVVIGVIGAIAIPRMASAATNSKIAALEADQTALQRALNLYAVEHSGLTPNHNADGSVAGDSAAFIARLTSRTDELGRPDAHGLFGPYLRALPTNPFASAQALRLDGDPTAQDSAWRFDTATNTIAPDQLRLVVSTRTGRQLGPGTASSSGTLAVSAGADTADAGGGGGGGTVGGRGGAGGGGAVAQQQAAAIEN